MNEEIKAKTNWSGMEGGINRKDILYNYVRF